MLDKNFDPANSEPRIREKWTRLDAFKAGAGAAADADPYCIVIPPPNVTGSLHMGHALNNTLQDVLIRFERMRGKNVLWQPGMDHAGIATQMVVERQMAERGEPGRREIGREAFLKKVWEWKAESGGAIINQLQRLGASCDWSRERFTMDEGLSRAVIKVFVELYRKDLIYKDKRLVNWDPVLHTAISDLEVEQIETNGHLWHFRYPLESDAERHVTVATTRPETMLGDTGVAVHPEDERYQDLIGQNVVLPLVGRHIPIVADIHADPEAGSGAVKITPAHDFNDFEVGRRHDLPAVNVMDIEANIILRDNEAFLAGVPNSEQLESTIERLHGLDRFAARDAVVEMMGDAGLIEKIEDHVHSVPHGDRGGVPVEPYLTDQWYVDAKTLAKPAIASVREGRTTFVPKSWEKTYFDWMENIQPWCISRQLWWGHRIPAWYGPDGKAFVAETEEAALSAAREHYGREESLTQDEDVLDTWFSSALWPFSTLGWPDQTPELARYYPTSVLVTAFDIIFFWVARMMMAGLEFLKAEPFHTVYIHALVRDEHGAKMSKSKGNVIDPLELIDEYGADALRFTLIAMAAQGRDIKLSADRVAGYRNFGTKLWNAARFCEMNGCRPTDEFAPKSAKSVLNKWILAEVAKTASEVTKGVDTYRFNEAAGAIYHFVWNTYCDWYLEFIKPILGDEQHPEFAETQGCAGYVLRRILLLLNPMMPYVTESLWDALAAPDRRNEVLSLSSWPTSDYGDPAAADEINWLVELISQIRSVRSEMNVAAAAKIPLVVSGAGDDIAMRLETHSTPIKRLARVSKISIGDRPPGGAVQVLVAGATISLPLADVIDLTAERDRLSKEIGRMDEEIARLDKKLDNEKFVARAPVQVVAGERTKRDDYMSQKDKLLAALRRLDDVT